MPHPFQRLAAKRRAEGKLASKKEIKAQSDFYRDVFSDEQDDKAIEEINREKVRRTFFHENGHCKAHNNKPCLYCKGMLGDGG